MSGGFRLSLLSETYLLSVILAIFGIMFMVLILISTNSVSKTESRLGKMKKP